MDEMTVAIPKPPRCPEHGARHPGCPACVYYATAISRRRRKLIAYGAWHPRTDVTAVAAHVRYLMAQGMSIRQISHESAVAWTSISKVYRGVQRSISTDCADRILRVKPLHPLGPVGIARRLQALAVMGYGVRTLGAQLGVCCCTVRAMRRAVHAVVNPSVQGRLIALYDELLLIPDGLGTTEISRARTRGRALAAGWLPPEAWTDATIDDPDAQPYSDPAAEQYIDEVRLRHARLPVGHPKRVRFVDLTYAEQLQLYREHVDQDRSPRAFVSDFRPVPVKTLRQMQADLGLEVVGRGEAKDLRVAG